MKSIKLWMNISANRKKKSYNYLINSEDQFIRIHMFHKFRKLQMKKRAAEKIVGNINSKMGPWGIGEHVISLRRRSYYS